MDQSLLTTHTSAPTNFSLSQKAHSQTLRVPLTGKGANPRTLAHSRASPVTTTTLPPSWDRCTPSWKSRRRSSSSPRSSRCGPRNSRSCSNRTCTSGRGCGGRSSHGSRSRATPRAGSNRRSWTKSICTANVISNQNGPVRTAIIDSMAIVMGCSCVGEDLSPLPEHISGHSGRSEGIRLPGTHDGNFVGGVGVFFC